MDAKEFDETFDNLFWNWCEGEVTYLAQKALSVLKVVLKWNLKAFWNCQQMEASLRLK
jgi:hypothetical protein